MNFFDINVVISRTLFFFKIIITKDGNMHVLETVVLFIIFVYFIFFFNILCFILFI